MRKLAALVRRAAIIPNTPAAIGSDGGAVVNVRLMSALARGSMLLLTLLTSIATLEAGVTAWTQGNTIWVTVSGTDIRSDQCCIGADIDEDPGFPPVSTSTSRFGPTVNGLKRPSKPVTDASCSIPCGQTSDTFSFGCNSLGPHTVYGYYADDFTGGYISAGSVTVNVTIPPPFFCPQFVLVSGGSMNLTHKYADAFSDIEYPGKQTTDGEMPMKIRTIAAPAGTVVYLRVTDPPDASPYGTPHLKDDNVDGGAGTIDGTRMTTVTLPANGSVPFVLRTTLNASGDNYEVAASANPALHTPSFVCDGSINCQKTKVTTYKRFYVEPNEMYRNSQLIRTNVLVGERLVYVDDRGFRRGDAVRLIHAPSYLRDQAGDVDGFYFEDRTIIDVGRNRNPNINAQFEIELDTGVSRWFGPDRPAGGVPLGDAIVNLSRNPQRSADPMFHMNPDYIKTVFSHAYVDLVTLPSNGIGMPLYDAMTEAQMVFAGAKWFAAKTSLAFVPSNTGLAVAAGTKVPLAAANQFSLGSTAGPYSYVWRESIDEATSGPRSQFPLTSGNDPNLTSGEVLVHELAHQWRVNSGYPDHECTHKSYDNPSKFCQSNGPQNSGQYDDGHVAFHYLGTTPATADSEYMTIRKASEPRPQ